MPARYLLYGPATTQIYPLSLHDALPISAGEACSGAVIALDRGVAEDEELQPVGERAAGGVAVAAGDGERVADDVVDERSEEHTSELQSRLHLVCRLLLEKKKV